MLQTSDSDLRLGFISQDEVKTSRAAMSKFALIALLVVLSVGDIVLCTVLFDCFGEVYAQYLNQATALVYCVVSTAILLCRRNALANRGNAAAPMWTLLIIGVLNGSGNWFQAVAQGMKLAGLTQSLLTTTAGIPLVMVLSFFFVSPRRAPSRLALLGAFLIVVGGAVSSLRDELNGGAAAASSSVPWYASLLFAVAQIFLSGEKVFEDVLFARFKALDAMFMFCVTMWTQFLLYLPLLPTQTWPSLGGLTLTDIPSVIYDGMRCTVGLSSTTPTGISLPTCSGRNTALFLAYVIVDMSCYCCGLYVIQRHGANLMVLASSVALPLQQLVFALPIGVAGVCGVTGSAFHLSDGLALASVLVGYYVYQWLSAEGRRGREEDGCHDDEEEHVVAVPGWEATI